MTEKELFIILASNDAPKKADAAILLEGDGYVRVPEAVRLWKDGVTKYIVPSGGVDDVKEGKCGASLLAKKLVRLGVPAKKIILEEKSTQTRTQALEVLTLAKQKKWHSIIIVASHFHLYRAFLTFLKVASETKMKILIYNSPAKDLSWFEKTLWGKRADLLHSEFEKIEEYRQKGHVASYQDAIKYFIWRESQLLKKQKKY